MVQRLPRSICAVTRGSLTALPSRGSHGCRRRRRRRHHAVSPRRRGKVDAQSCHGWQYGGGKDNELVGGGESFFSATKWRGGGREEGGGPSWWSMGARPKARRALSLARIDSHQGHQRCLRGGHNRHRHSQKNFKKGGTTRNIREPKTSHQERGGNRGERQGLSSDDGEAGVFAVGEGDVDLAGEDGRRRVLGQIQRLGARVRFGQLVGGGLARLREGHF